MAQIAEAAPGTEFCEYGPHEIDPDDCPTDSNGLRCCWTCYRDGTAYVEPVDLARDNGGGW